MNLDFLAVHDATLRLGASLVSPGFKSKQIEFILSCQCDDGGFRGRGGGSDPYYTDFACRTLWLLGESTGSAVDSVLSLGLPPKDVIEAFCRLNVLRLAGCLESVSQDGFRSALDRQIIGGGIYARPGASTASAYHTFLAWLTRSALGDVVDIDTSALEALRVDGGFCESSGETAPQTSSTAAATGALLMAGCDPDIDEFLSRMQATDGGFLAHPSAPHGDLLSTYTAYLTLAMTGHEGSVDARSMATFLKETAFPDGGFRSCSLDMEADVEYTFYGVATTALLYAGFA